MREKVIEHIKNTFRAHRELAELLPTEAFGQKLSTASNTIGGQFWCLDLLEHETQHQGQLIRYVYGLKYKFPKSWAERWALEE